MRPLHLIAAACVAHAQNTVLLCGSAHTGTHHVKLALEALGLDVTVDHPQNARYEAHLAAHPSTKVLLTTRDAGRWRTSIQQSRPEAALEKAQARREAYEKGVRAASGRLCWMLVRHLDGLRVVSRTLVEGWAARCAS